MNCEGSRRNWQTLDRHSEPEKKNGNSKGKTVVFPKYIYTLYRNARCYLLQQQIEGYTVLGERHYQKFAGERIITIKSQCVNEHFSDVIWSHVTQWYLVIAQGNNIPSPLLSRNVFFKWQCHTKVSQKKSKIYFQGAGLI